MWEAQPDAWEAPAYAHGQNPRKPIAMTLSALLSSSMFTAEEASRALSAPTLDGRKLLDAVRGESETRYLQALGALFERMTWSDRYAAQPLFDLVALDFLTTVDLRAIAGAVDGPDAAFALDVVRAVELDDATAAARVKERIMSQSVPEGLTALPKVRFVPPEEPTGALRVVSMVRELLGGTEHEQLRAATEWAGFQGRYAASLAALIARDHGWALPEDLPRESDTKRLGCRLMSWVAQRLFPELAEEMLALLVDKEWDRGDLEAYAFEWTREVEKVAQGKHVVTRQLGGTVFKAVAPFDSCAGPPPKKVVLWKITAKTADLKKASKEVDKAAAAAGDAPAFDRPGLDRRLYQQATSERERVAELLRCGASASSAVDADPYFAGHTVLHRAAGGQDGADVTRRLLAAGADPNAVWRGKTVIDCWSGRGGLAAQAVSETAVGHLVAAGCKSTHPDNLFEAARLGYRRFAAALVGAGADLDARVDGKTAREVALENKHLRTAIALGHRL